MKKQGMGGVMMQDGPRNIIMELLVIGRIVWHIGVHVLHLLGESLGNVTDSSVRGSLVRTAITKDFGLTRGVSPGSFPDQGYSRGGRRGTSDLVRVFSAVRAAYATLECPLGGTVPFC